MIKRMATAAALAVILASAASAQSPAPAETPATPPASSPASPSTPSSAPTTDGTTTGSVPTPQSEAGAAAIPSTTEACIAAAADLGTAAEGKTLPDDKLDQLDVLFSKMETLCDGNQLEAAMNVAKDIKTMLDGQ